MTRRGLGILVLAGWVCLLAWHVRREYFQPELARLAAGVLTLAPGTHFHLLKMGDQSIGISSSLLDTVPEGFVIEDQMNLDLLALGQAGGAVAQSRVVLSPLLQMKEFSFSMNSGGQGFSADGVVEGDSLLRVRIDAGGGQVDDLEYRVAEAPLLAAALPIRLAKGGELRVGRSLRAQVFDPSTLSLRAVEVDVLERGTIVLPDSAILDPQDGRWIPSEGRSVPAWRVRESFGGISLESWIDEDGRIIRSTSPMGFTVERMPYELALQSRDATRAAGAGGAVGSDVILSTAIGSNVDLGEVEQHDELRFVLSGVDLDGFHLDGGRQVLRGDTLIVRRENWEELVPGYSLPYPRMDLREALEPEPLIQSGDPRMEREARAAAGIGALGRADPLAVAARLSHSVYQSLEKEVSFSLPSALQVLDTLRGDCNEHTVLYVALARSVGLPARPAAGLVYLDGSFYYHAWPEVWLGEWVAVDPTLGSVPAGAAHLRFITGTLAQQVEIARLIGMLSIEVMPPS